MWPGSLEGKRLLQMGDGIHVGVVVVFCVLGAEGTELEGSGWGSIVGGVEIGGYKLGSGGLCVE